MKLMIVESPGKVKKIREILGNGWKVAASVGHVRDLPEKEMGVAAPDFKPRYVATERGKEVLSKLMQDVKSCDAVFLATDLDREGEAIAWHLKQALKLDNPQRVTFNEITPAAIKSSLAAPRSINIPMVAAQESRRVLDRLVGYMVSPELSQLSGSPLSAGRVQSPAVRVIVDRERAIEQFTPTAHFGVKLSFDGGWSAEWDVKPFLDEGSEYFMSAEIAGRIAQLRDLQVLTYEEKTSSKAPPAPFITSTLQQAASNKLKMKPKATMAAAQKLYEQGHITYMRTDNPNLSDDALIGIYQVCKEKGLKMASKARTWKAKEDAQEAHEAIRPSHFEIEDAGSTADEKALYKLIWERAVACQLESAQYAVRSARLRAFATFRDTPLEFVAEGKTLTNPGWTALFADDSQSDDDKEPLAKNPVPQLQEGAQLTAIDGGVLSKKTRAPSRFTEASLINELERRGIGRPSTYAAIIDNISSRGYIGHDSAGKYLVPTETGKLIVDALVKGRFSFIEYEFTRDMESLLDRIAQGKATYKEIVSEVYQRLERELAGLSSFIKPKHPCPECGKALSRRKGAKGFFWGCAGYPDCNVILPDAAGKPGQPKPKAPVSDFNCPDCGKPLIRRKKAGTGGKKGYDFFGCSGFPKCDAKFNAANGKPVFDKS